MDQSEEYVDMCKAAKEIQDLWKPVDMVDGDVLAIETNTILDDGIRVEYSGPSAWSGYEAHNYPGLPEHTPEHPRIVWCPRQDQLQEMARTTLKLCGVANVFRDFKSYLEFKINYDPSSFEKAWLSWYMWRMCSKEWNGEEWVKA